MSLIQNRDVLLFFLSCNLLLKINRSKTLLLIAAIFVLITILRATFLIFSGRIKAFSVQRARAVRVVRRLKKAEWDTSFTMMMMEKAYFNAPLR